jgi:hypothetical protein
MLLLLTKDSQFWFLWALQREDGTIVADSGPRRYESRNTVIADAKRCPEAKKAEIVLASP